VLKYKYIVLLLYFFTSLELLETNGCGNNHLLGMNILPKYQWNVWSELQHVIVIKCSLDEFWFGMTMWDLSLLFKQFGTPKNVDYTFLKVF
jgi:hypothetical protein